MQLVQKLLELADLSSQQPTRDNWCYTEIGDPSNYMATEGADAHFSHLFYARVRVNTLIIVGHKHRAKSGRPITSHGYNQRQPPLKSSESLPVWKKTQENHQHPRPCGKKIKRLNPAA